MIDKVCPWLVLLAWHTNEHLVNTSREFWHLFFAFFCWNWTFAKTQESVRFENKVCPWLVLLAWYTNEHLVNTSREFWHLFFIFFCWNCNFAKTQENMWFENKVCPCFVLQNLKLWVIFYI